jgi:hypothetical protein
MPFTGQGIEIAVIAFMLAEWDMDVDSCHWGLKVNRKW